MCNEDVLDASCGWQASLPFDFCSDWHWVAASEQNLYSPRSSHFHRSVVSFNRRDGITVSIDTLLLNTHNTLNSGESINLYENKCY